MKSRSVSVLALCFCVFGLAVIQALGFSNGLQSQSGRGKDQSKSQNQSPSDQSGKSKSAEQAVRISVTLVQVDAVVTDKDGKLVTDLTKDDFEILEDGRKQQITNFSFVSTGGGAADSAPVPKTDRNAPALPLRLKPEQVRRTIALVVDDLGMSFESIVYVRSALRQFVDQQMQPGDLVAIIRTGAGIGVLQQFTTDKRLLHAAIDRVRFNLMGRGHQGAFPPINAASAPLPIPQDTSGEDPVEEMEAFRQSLLNVGTLGTVGYVVGGLDRLPGRKSIILLSEGFRLFDDARHDYRALDAVSRLIDQANRASVVIYTIDPRGNQYTGPTAADRIGGAGPQQLERLLAARRTALFETQGGLQHLAHKTGGIAIRNTNDLSGGVERVLKDQQGYYLLGYIPEESTFRRDRGRVRFHNFTVKVKRRGLRVRTRSGFYGISDEEVKPDYRGPGAQIVEALTSPFAGSDVRLKLTSLFGNDATEGSFVRSILHIDTRDLTFVEKADGWRKAVFDIVAMTFGDNGQIVDRVSKRFELEAKGETYERMLRQGVIYTLNLPVKKPGVYQLRSVLRDSASEKIGSAHQFIEVPDIEKDRLLLSGLVLSNLKKAGSTESASPRTQLASNVDAQIPDTEVEAHPGRRAFRPGSLVDYGFVIFNAKLDRSTRRPQLEAQIQLLREGAAVYSSPIRTLKIGDQADLKRILAGGSIRLGNDLEPGEYVLQIVVFDKLAKDKHRRAAQWIDLDVVR
jgi:VWFA-related protein